MKQTIFLTLGLMVLFIVGCTEIPPEENTELKKFTSKAEMKQFLENNVAETGFYGHGRNVAMVADMAVAESAQAVPKAAGASDYSATNIQVKGVDEADIVKNDGKYIYVISGKKVIILDAYPAEDAEILSEIEFEERPRDLYINEDRLVVLGQDHNSETFKIMCVDCVRPSSSESYVKIYDVSDREDPGLENEFSLEGNYFNSRMIGDYVYIIANQYVNYRDDIIPLPIVQHKGVAEEIPASEIYYFPMPDTAYQYTHVASINVQEDEKPNTKVFLTGNSQNIYVSQDNIYLTNMKRTSRIHYWEKMISDVIIPLFPNELEGDIETIMDSDKPFYEKQNEIEIAIQNFFNKLDEDEKEQFEDQMRERTEQLEIDFLKESQKTVINKISIDRGEIEYETQGEVPGDILNQFSMDEHEGNFRIATTISGYVDNRDISTNNMYVLDEDLDPLGKVEEIAPGESIYSVRFMGDRAYMVTFKHVDPLFVIDLEHPEDPEVLGKLKIPGYSDYLHPYDETHLIGIGKEVDASIDADKIHTEGAVYYTAIQGVKLAIFDVSDVQNPVEMYKEVIGDRGTESLATREHKAFLFDRDKELLVVPMTVAELKEGQDKSQQGDFTFQGAYVYNINLEDGFDLRGRVSHIEDPEVYKKSGYYLRSDSAIKRSLYMDDVLYTISDKAVKMNDLADIEEINKIELPFEEEENYYPGIAY